MGDELTESEREYIMENARIQHRDAKPLTVKPPTTIAEGGEGVNPRAVLKAATDQANALMEIVSKRNLYQEIRGKKFLTSEAWCIIGAFNRVDPVTEYVKAVRNPEGQIVAYEAKVNLTRDGVVVGSGIQACGLDGFTTKGKTGYDKHRSAMSSAQTWATSRAYRLKFAWVAVMAGFAGTPAEEMHGSQPATESPGRPSESPQTPEKAKSDKISIKQVGRLHGIARDNGWKEADVKEEVLKTWGYESTKDIHWKKYKEIVAFFETPKGKPESDESPIDGPSQEYPPAPGDTGIIEPEPTAEAQGELIE